MANPAVTYEDFNAEENTAHEEHIEIIRQEAEWFDLTPIEKKLCGASLDWGLRSWQYFWWLSACNICSILGQGEISLPFCVEIFLCVDSFL